MKIIQRIFASLCLLSGLFLVSESVEAQARIRCESEDGSREYCRIPGGWSSEVRFSRQLSKSECREGISWGIDRHEIWVDRGCRAEFEVFSRSSGGRPQPDRGWNPPSSGSSNQDWREITRAREALQRDRQALERDRAQLDRERRDFEKERARFYEEQRGQDRCPSGYKPGRCTDKQRRNGCKDFRTSSGLGCMGFR
jgi:hypothetical protein